MDGRVDPVGLAQPSDYLRFRFQHHRLGWYGVTWTPLGMIAPEVVTPTGTYQEVGLTQAEIGRRLGGDRWTVGKAIRWLKGMAQRGE